MLKKMLPELNYCEISKKDKGKLEHFFNKYPDQLTPIKEFLQMIQETHANDIIKISLTNSSNGKIAIYTSRPYKSKVDVKSFNGLTYTHKPPIYGKVNVIIALPKVLSQQCYKNHSSK